MSFILTKDRIKSAIDPERGARMAIDGGLDIDFQSAKFTSPEISLLVQIEIREKFSDKPMVARDPSNPCVMISAGFLDLVFKTRNMRDFDYNTNLVKYLVRMIAFINKRYPLARAPFLWSDYEKLAADRGFLYRMPSDDELLKLSLEPE